MKKKLGGFGAFLLALLAAFGIYKPNPAPSPTPTPTATATAQPEPTTEPTALPSPVDVCNLPPSTGDCHWPPTIHPRFQRVVEDVQAHVPQHFFDPEGKVKDEGAYVLEVSRRLRLAGLCAIQGTTVFDEVWLKDSNGHSEHFDIVRADRTPITLYAARCAPAAF